jgi:hypothetical protein
MPRVSSPTFEEAQALRQELLERIEESGRHPYDYLMATHMYEGFVYHWVTRDPWLIPPRYTYERLKAALNGEDISSWPLSSKGSQWHED